MANRFRDATMTIEAGTTVEGANDGTNVHTASALDGSFDSGLVSTGKTFPSTFDKPGQDQAGVVAAHHQVADALSRSGHHRAVAVRART